MPRKRTAIAGRFWSHVAVQENGCWIWTGAPTGKNGYGQVREPGRGGRRVTAHRWAYEAFVGPIPKGMQLDHFRCDNKKCVNPYHVRPVTPRENVLRADSPIAWQVANAMGVQQRSA